MKTRNITAALAALGFAAAFASCDRDSVEPVAFSVSAPQSVVAGHPVTFEFEGNPDYITFYSGEKDACYDNRDRTQLDRVASLDLSYYAKMQYAENYDYVGKRILRVMISTSYDGSGNIDPSQWRELTDPDQAVNGKYLEPLVLKTSTVVEQPSAEINLDEYKDQNFYLAVRYACPPHTGVKSKGDIVPGTSRVYTYDNRPRVEVNGLKLTKKDEAGNTYIVEDMASEFGFRTILVNSKTATNFNISSYRLQMQGMEYVTDTNGNVEDIDQNYDMDVWLVSKMMNARDVTPDYGTPVKSANARVLSFQHTYYRPGIYKAVFVATNANKWNGTSSVHEVTVEVKPDL